MTDTRADDVVEDLVHQFSDPFAFFRELIQNSIDAGSTRIEVSLRFAPGPKKGLLSASVADWGEGMNRRLIEDYLVTKFRSSKENDFTKIGKFGIGFVSLFACAPDAVVVDTGRDGESWRVLFKKDRSYELLSPNEVFEGTRITLHKALTAPEYLDFVTRSLASVKKWCRYSDADVTFTAGPVDGGELPEPVAVREEVGVESPFCVEHVEEGTRIVLGPSETEPPLTGFYNRGLTLLETEEPLVPGVTMRVVSRYLEHTLTRDNVRRDAHFHKVVELAQDLVRGKLVPGLPEASRLAAQRADGARDWAVLFRYALRHGDPLKLWFRQPGGGALEAAAVRKAAKHHGELVVSATPSAVALRLAAAGVPVVEATPGEQLVNELLRALDCQRLAVADEAFTYAEPPGATPTLFLEELTRQLGEVGARVQRVAVAKLEGAASEARWALVDAVGLPVPRARALMSPFDRGAPGLLCLNTAHRDVAPAVALFTSAPRLAAMLMTRGVLVAHGKLTAKVDQRLLEGALA